jgi:hypothetical protein
MRSKRGWQLSVMDNTQGQRPRACLTGTLTNVERPFAFSHIGFFDNRNVLRDEEFVTVGACAP